jgi:hypothetical protein
LLETRLLSFQLKRLVDGANRRRRVSSVTTSEIFRSDDPCDIAMTLIPALPSAPNTPDAIPGVPRM